MKSADYQLWADAGIAELRRLYSDHSASEIASVLGMTIKRVQNKAHSLGLRKSPEWIAACTRKLMADPKHPARASRFKKGLVPHNKGKPHPSTGRAIETQFKPGNVPHTWNQIGHDRETKEGYLQRKVSDTGVKRRDYAAIHHLVWRMHGCSIPPGHALAFRDGDKRNFDINNLELITRAELMARNTVHRLPKEVARAVQLVGALRRQINKREMAAHEHNG